MNKDILFGLFFYFLVFGQEGESLTNPSNRTGDGPPVSRSEVIRIAHDFTRVHWFHSEANQTVQEFGEDFISQYPAGHRLGVGYKWNAWDDVDTFIQKIAEGCGTGTGGYVSYEDYPFDCVTGTSCTGFVSRAWRLEHKYTLTYPNRPDIPRQFHEITHEIPGVDFRSGQTKALRRGDAFMNKYHIILFIYETRDGTAMVMDSSTEGVGFREMSWQELADGEYKAIRYNLIVEDDIPSGTMNHPILIDSKMFPLEIEGNTRDAVSMVFDRYSAEPSLNEQGPEVIYRMEIHTPGRVQMFKKDILNEGIDNDLYLLSSLRKEEYLAADCIARGDSWIDEGLATGVYYLVVDSGKDQPGEFKLEVRFVEGENL
jgi:hypothetical protein